MTGLAALPILAFIYANVFPIYFTRTGFSIALTVAATSLPFLYWSIILQRLLREEIADRAQYSDAKAFMDALLAFVISTVIIVVAAYTPDHCSNAKCKFGEILFGPLIFVDFWFASIFGGLAASGALSALYRVFRRRITLRR
ncbi:hypothetical protein CO665_28175 [Rhizobium anhuiense]|uniref:hypothetical protein n=1 Tax=Rhizobium anhuiense TaxID=1184720 RepID=UPI000BEA6240|nr:hypothetical protein [Rhizobium anhuiense]PDS34835.1 hypothetical protein CO665_28175 [Rhizobium anhuiense]